VEKAASNQKVAVSLNLEKGTDMLRKSGIEVVGDVPWGTHFCLFYETKEDLIDVLMPYFKAGLEDNEFCMWVTSEPLTEEESKNAMRKVVPNFDRYLKRGQMEIVPHSKWYLKDGSFNMQRVLDGWIDKLNQALDKGYDGIRVTGNTAWLEKRDWKNFTDYEEKVNSVIGKHRMMAICTYSLARCGALEVVDVISNHQFALIRREGEWEIIESSERKQTEETLRESEENFRNIFENANDTMIFLDIYGRILDANKKAVEVFGGSKEELLGKHFTKVGVFSPRDTPQVLSAFAKVLAGKIGTLTVSIRNKRGKEMALECSGSATKIGDKLAVLVIGRDITERKRMEETLRQSQEKYRNMVELAPDGIMTVNTKGFITSINPAFSTLTGYSKDEIVGKHFTKLPTIQMKDILKFVKLSGSFFRGKTIPLVEFVYRRKDGTIAWGEAHPCLLKEGDKIVGAQAILRDITERKKAEDTLRKSEIKHRTLLENLPQRIFLKDRNSVYVSCNENYARDLKIKSNEIAGKTDYDFYTKELAEKYRADDKKIMESEETQDIEEEYIQDGHKIFVHTVKTPVKDENGNVVGILGIFWDITERKKAEEELIRLSNAVKMSADSIVIGGLDAKIIDVNEVTLKMYGTDNKRDLIGKSSFDLIAPEDREKALAGMKEVLEKEYSKDREYNIITKDGSRIPVEMNTAIMKDADGKPIGFVAISRDITERKEMEEKLRQYSEHLEELVQKRTEELLESEKRYSVLVEEASDGIVILQDGKIILSNKRAAEILGYPKDELIGLSIEKPVSEEYRQLVKERYQRRLLGDKVPATYEVEAMTKTGQRIPIEVGTALIIYQGRPADLVVMRDIRKRKLMEEERLRLEKLATIGELATMVAHDLRNPLTSIRNAGYYIKNTCPNRANTECKAALEMLNIIEQETIFANNIINDLLDFAAKRPLQKKRKNINKLIEDSLTRSNMPENIKIETNFAKKPVANVDEKQLERVFLNLTKNAVQAMPNGGKLTITTNETKDYIEIALADTGVGIQEENMSKLFTPLFTTKAKGIGMGLAICKNLVEQHNGTIEVKSKVGQGTTFTIKLPKKEEANNQ
jgi:PAS domain S-box-containing protein